MSLLSPRTSRLGAFALTGVAVLAATAASAGTAVEYWESQNRTLNATASLPLNQQPSVTVPERWTAAMNEYKGVQVKVESTRGAAWEIHHSPTSGTRIVTGEPSNPEWIITPTTTYARISVEELAANRQAFESINKPRAHWTDSAGGAARWKNVARTLDLEAGFRELALVTDPTTQGKDAITWNIPCDKWVATRWAPWEEPFGEQCSVRVYLDQDGTPETFVSADEMHEATWSVEEWGTVSIDEPLPWQVLTLEDIAAADPRPTPATSPNQARDSLAEPD